MEVENVKHDSSLYIYTDIFMIGKDTWFVSDQLAVNTHILPLDGTLKKDIRVEGSLSNADIA